MATYTGVADANGDFTIPFSTSYTGGQKVTVKAEKGGAEKSIELNAPSEVVGGGVIQFSGSLNNFPDNVGTVTLKSDLTTIKQFAFIGSGNANCLWAKSTGLIIEGAITIERNAFDYWINASTLKLPNSLLNIGSSAFSRFNKATSLEIPDSVQNMADSSFSGWVSAKSLKIGSGITSIPASCFSGWTLADEILIPDSVLNIYPYSFQDWSSCKKVTIGLNVSNIQSFSFRGLTSCIGVYLKPTIPPTLGVSAFDSLKSDCIFYIPSASLANYKTATNWSAFSSRMVGY